MSIKVKPAKPRDPTTQEQTKGTLARLKGAFNGAWAHVANPNLTWKERLWSVEKAYLWMPWTVVKAANTEVEERVPEYKKVMKQVKEKARSPRTTVAHELLKVLSKTKVEKPVEAMVQQKVGFDPTLDTNGMEFAKRMQHQAKQAVVQVAAQNVENKTDPTTLFGGLRAGLQSLNLIWDAYENGNHIDLERILRKAGIQVTKSLREWTAEEIEEAQKKLDQKEIKLPKPLIELINERKAGALRAKVEEKQKEIDRVKKQLREINGRLDKPFELWTNEDVAFVIEAFREKKVQLPGSILDLLYGNFKKYYALLEKRKAVPAKPMKDWTHSQILDAQGQLALKGVNVQVTGRNATLAELMELNFDEAHQLIEQHGIVIPIPLDEMTHEDMVSALQSKRMQGALLGELDPQLHATMQRTRKELRELMDSYEVRIVKDLEQFSGHRSNPLYMFGHSLLAPPLRMMKAAADSVIERPTNLRWMRFAPSFAIARAAANAGELEDFAYNSDVDLQQKRVDLMQELKALELDLQEYEADYQRAIDLNFGIKGFANNYRTIYNNIIYFTDLIVDSVKGANLFDHAKLQYSIDFDFVKAVSGADNALWAQIYLKHKDHVNFDWAAAFCKYELNREIKDAEDFKAFCEEHGVEHSQFYHIYEANKEAAYYPFAEKALELAGYLQANDNRTWPQRFLDLVHFNLGRVLEREAQITNGNAIRACAAPRNTVDKKGFWDADEIDVVAVKTLPKSFTFNWKKEVTSWAEKVVRLQSRDATTRKITKEMLEEQRLHLPGFLKRTKWGFIYLTNKDNPHFNWAQAFCESCLQFPVTDAPSFAAFCQSFNITQHGEGGYQEIIDDESVTDKDFAHEALALVGYIDEFDERSWAERFLDLSLFNEISNATPALAINGNAQPTMLPEDFHFGMNTAAVDKLKRIPEFNTVNFDKQLETFYAHRTKIERVIGFINDSLIPALIWSICSLIQLTVRAVVGGTLASTWATLQLFDLLYTQFGKLRLKVFQPFFEFQAIVSAEIWQITKLLTLEPALRSIIKRQFAHSNKFIDRLTYSALSKVKFFGEDVIGQLAGAFDEIIRNSVLATTTIDHEYAIEKIIKDSADTNPFWLQQYQANKDDPSFDWVALFQNERGSAGVTNFDEFKAKYLTDQESTTNFIRQFAENYNYLVKKPREGKVKSLARKVNLNWILAPYVGTFLQDVSDSFNQYKFWEMLEPRRSNLQEFRDDIQDLTNGWTKQEQARFWAELDLILSGQVDLADGLSWPQRYLYLKNKDHWISHYMLHRFDANYDWASVYLQTKRGIRIQKRSDFTRECSARVTNEPKFKVYTKISEEKKYAVSSWAEEFLKLENDQGDVSRVTWVSLGNEVVSAQKFVTLMSGSAKSWEEQVSGWVQSCPSNDIQRLITAVFPKQMTQFVWKIIRGDSEISLAALLQKARKEHTKPGSRLFSGFLAIFENFLKELRQLQLEKESERVSTEEAQLSFQNELEHTGFIRNSLGLATKAVSRYTIFPSDLNNIAFNGMLYTGSANLTGLDLNFMADASPVSEGFVSSAMNTANGLVSAQLWLPWNLALAVVNPLNYLKAAWLGVQISLYAPAVMNHVVGAVAETATREVEKTVPVAQIILVACKVVTPWEAK